MIKPSAKMNKIENAVYKSFIRYRIDSRGELLVAGEWKSIRASIKAAMKRSRKNVKISR